MTGKRTILVILTLALPVALQAQTAYLVKDINATTNSSPSSSFPSNFFGFNSQIFFTARSQLWATDGTVAGTAPIGTVTTGVGAAVPQFAVVNGKLIFNGRRSSSGGEVELWTTDGTSAGTRLLADINPGFSSFPGDRIVYHDKMFFAADDGVDGVELWVTDGTPAGTRFFKDLSPGPYDSFPGSFVIFHDLLYFSASGALWKSDGIENGTVMVKPLVSPSNLVVAGKQLFFTGYTVDEGEQLWASDGTEEGTQLAGTTPGSDNRIYNATPFGDRVLVVAGDQSHGIELWISDGTPTGTHIVRDINPGPASSIGGGYTIAVLGSTAFFCATTPSTGAELWKTDGTETGTTLLRDIIPGPENSAASSFVVASGKVFFAASTGGYPTLWTTDGTETGTQQVKTSDTPFISIYYGTILTNIGGILYFAGANTLNGYEPWKSDGTAGGTSMIANIARDAAPSSDPRNITAAGDLVYFEAWDGTGPFTTNGGTERSIWRTDGTPEGTFKVTSANSETRYIPFGRSILFDRNNTLWISDGTPEGTGVANNFLNRFPSKPLILFTTLEKIFALAGPNSEMWATTTAPDAPAVPLGVNNATGFVDIGAGRVMFFTSGNSFTNSILWISDGSRAGTHVVSDLGSGVNSGPVAMGGSLYFGTGSSSGTTFKLAKSDGTFEGTVGVTTLPAPLGTLKAAGKNLFMIVGSQLWVTDGTDAGTHSLPANPVVGPLTAAGDHVVFSATDSVNGTELWTSDGTTEGTHILRDIYPGPFGTAVSTFASFEGLVYFTAPDDLHGSELWVTDGTSAGTTLAADVEPGPTSSFPNQFARAGERIFFNALTSATGAELWALPLPSTPRLAINDIRVGEGDTGTSTARFTLTLTPASSKSVTVDYTTSDVTATAGSDYDAASGTITFAAGETSKSIDVVVHGDTIPENNETFFVTLRNPFGATLAKSSGFAVIEDDDPIADLALSLDFSRFTFFTFFVMRTNATNNGPRTATNIKVVTTATPSIDAPNACSICPVMPALAPGATGPVLDYRGTNFQQWVTATATQLQRDPQTANNSVGWTQSDFMAMDALYLTVGAQGNIWFSGSSNAQSISIESSDPAVISVPSSLDAPANNKPVSFVAHALSAGRATIRLFTPSTSYGVLSIDVVPIGAKPRFPGVVLGFPLSSVTFDQPISITTYTAGTAPYTGEPPTGVVTITNNGQELTRVTLNPTVRQLPVPFYLPQIGTSPITVNYSGDANFLPVTVSTNLTATIGVTTIIAGAERLGSTAIVHARLTGSPVAAPTGTITISEPGLLSPKVVQLTDSGSGIAQAEVTLPNVSAGPHTFVITYSGDAHYSAASQNARLVEARLRPVKH